LVKGNQKFATKFQGKTYLFPGKKQLDMFNKTPEKYTGLEIEQKLNQLIKNSKK